MSIKIQGDNMQYGDTAIATLSTDALTLQSGTSLNAQKLTASNGMEITNHMTADNGVVTVTGKLTASNGMHATGDLTIGYNSTLHAQGKSQFTGLLTVFGDMNIGQNGHSDAITIYSTFNTNLVPTYDSNADLGTSDLQWAEAHVDHGHIDDITSTGTSNLATVNVTGKLTASNGIAVTGDVSFDDANFSGDVTLGSAATDVTTVTGQLTASNGIKAVGGSRFGNYGVSDSTLDVYAKSIFYEHLTASNGLHITNGELVNSEESSFYGEVRMLAAVTASNGIFLSSTGELLSAAPVDFRNDVALGYHASNTITVPGRFGSDLLPITDSAHDLGSSTRQWAEVHVDHGYIDDITATGTSTLTTVDINGGAIDGTIIGANSAVAGTFSDLTISGKLTASNGIAVTGESTFSGDVLPGAVTNTLGDDSNQWAYLYSKGAEFDDANATINMPGAFVVSKSANFTTISTKLTASNGISITNHLAADNGVVTVSGQLTASNGLTVNGNVNFDDAAFSGDVSLGDGRADVITVNGVATFTEQLTASNGIAVAGDATFAQRATFSGVTTVSAQLTASNGARIVGDVAIAGITTITGQLTASQGASITGDVLLGENDTIKAGVYITYSDATLKENIEVISNPIDKVMSMRGVTYNLKSSSGNPEVGFLAQEMKQAVPEVVYGNGDGNLGIDYAKLTSVLVEAIKTQQTQIQEQQSQIDELKDTLLKK